MSTGRGARGPGAIDPTFAMTCGAAVIAIAAYGATEVALHLGSPLSGVDQSIPGGPISLVKGLAAGQVVWSSGATAMMIFTGILALSAVAAGTAWVIIRRGRVTRVDDAGLYLARPKDVERLSSKAVAADTSRLGTPLVDGELPGAPLGDLVLGPNRRGIRLYAGPEDVAIDIWGPRMGKTTCRIIPEILAARGAVLTTSNKRDVVDETRAYRAEKGAVWVFDPQGVAQELPRWFFDPLSWVRRAQPSTTRALADADPAESAARAEELTELLGGDFVSRMGHSAQESKAAQLASVFANSITGENARRDPFFDPTGERLVTGFILAAAAADLPLPIIYTWATDPREERPVALLREHGFERWADAVLAQYSAPDKQRGGVFATAANMLGCLAYAEVHPWISRISATDTRPEFDPVAFAAGGSPTLYSLSMEGTGECGALVTALTIAVTDGFVDAATATPVQADPPLPAGRLRVPATIALDEAANVVRWKELPSLYSHFGSRGLRVTTILQSWSQGEECWGEKGMRKLWSASTIRVYGGGVALEDGQFLDKTSTALGDHWEMTDTVSAGPSGRSTSKQRTKIRTLTPADLEALPAGRAILRSSKNVAALIATLPWYADPIADEVAAAKIRAGQDPTPGVDEDLDDTEHLLPAPRTVSLTKTTPEPVGVSR